MIQQVHSPTPLEEYDYKARPDGLADVRIRHDIRQETIETENGPCVDYVAEESYQILPLTELEVVDQVDELWQADYEASTPMRDRVKALEQSALDNADVLANLLSAAIDGGLDVTDDDPEEPDESDKGDTPKEPDESDKNSGDAGTDGKPDDHAEDGGNGGASDVEANGDETSDTKEK